MKTKSLIRYYRNGWRHAELKKSGRKWVVVRDLHLSRRTVGDKVTYVRRVRRVKLAETAPALW